MSPLDLVKLSSLMKLTSGRAETIVGLIDGPVAMSHADLAAEKIREIPGRLRGTCARGRFGRKSVSVKKPSSTGLA